MSLEHVIVICVTSGTGNHRREIKLNSFVSFLSSDGLISHSEISGHMYHYSHFISRLPRKFIASMVPKPLLLNIPASRISHRKECCLQPPAPARDPSHPHRHSVLAPLTHTRVVPRRTPGTAAQDVAVPVVRLAAPVLAPVALADPHVAQAGAQLAASEELWWPKRRRQSHWRRYR